MTSPRLAAPLLTVQAVVVLLLAPGCGGGASPVTSGDVHGTIVDGFWDAAGTRTTAAPAGVTSVPQTVQVAALSVASGGYHRYPGTISAAGEITIPGVEPGSYLLELRSGTAAPRYFELTGRQVDLGSEFLGHAGAGAAAGTALDLTVDGLDPTATDSIVSALLPGSRAQTSVSAAAAAASLTLSPSLAGLPLPEPTDQGWVYQAAGAPPPAGLSGTYRRVTRAGAFTASPVDGARVPVAVTLTAPGATGQQAASWRTGDFEAYKAQMVPAVFAAGHAMTVRAVPFALAGAPTAPTPALATVAVADGAGTLDTGGMQWGRFLPASWKEVRTTAYTVSAPFVAPGAATTGFAASVSITDPISVASTLTPRTSPPRHPTVAALDGMSPQAGVGLTPRLAWGAPDLGDTGNYIVSIISLVNVNGITAYQTIATFRLVSRRLDVPEGLLQSGGTYFATIAAVSSPGFDRTRPLHPSIPAATAPVVLATFTP